MLFRAAPTCGLELPPCSMGVYKMREREIGNDVQRKYAKRKKGLEMSTERKREKKKKNVKRRGGDDNNFGNGRK